jgi:hypothetical protein
MKTNWQPIETAPKDGTFILIYLGDPWNKVEMARWYDTWNNWQTDILPDYPEREEVYGIGSCVPTHWMPLPEAPTFDEL